MHFFKFTIAVTEKGTFQTDSTETASVTKTHSTELTEHTCSRLLLRWPGLHQLHSHDKK